MIDSVLMQVNNDRLCAYKSQPWLTFSLWESTLIDSKLMRVNNDWQNDKTNRLKKCDKQFLDGKTRRKNVQIW